MARLAAATDGWDEPRIALWVDKLCSLSNDEAARRTAEAIIDTWPGPSSPPWAHFVDTYNSICRNERLSRPALEAPRNGMLHSEYMALLRQRAESGDEAAVRELRSWARVRRTPIAEAITDLGGSR
jgi:hypothetical protein